MTGKSCEVLDPRIRRTRRLLQQALEKCLEKKEFDEISVQDITEAATVNRATFYDHYPDKFALLECTVGSRFHDLLTDRQVQFDGTCASALKAIVVAVCDYVRGLRGPDGTRALEPHMQSAIIAVVRRMILEGLKLHPPEQEIACEMIAASASWAIFGAAMEWAQMPEPCASEKIADTVTALISPILRLPHRQPEHSTT